MKTAIKSVFVFLFFAICSNISLAQNNYLILNSRMPMHSESATSLKQNELQWGLGFLGELQRRKEYKYDYYPSNTLISTNEYNYFGRSGAVTIDYGILDNFQAGIYMAGGLKHSGFDYANVNLKYVINSDENKFPALSVSIAHGGYWGIDPYNTANLTLRVALSKTFSNFRTHINIINYDAVNTNAVEPGRKFDIGGAVDYNFSKAKFLLMSEVFVNSIPDTRYEYRVGAKKQFGNDFLIYLGAGSSVGKQFHPVYNINLGMTWYGFGFLKDL